MSEEFIVTVEGEEVKLGLVPILDMAISDELLATIRQYIPGYKDLSVDGSAVERVSTPCLQVLIAAAFKVEKDGGTFKIDNCSTGLERGMRDLGLSEYLKNWSKN